MEEHFRDTFRGFELPVEPADFDAILRKMKQKKRRRFFWILLLAGGFFSALVGFWLSRDSSGSQTKNQLATIIDSSDFMQGSNEQLKATEQAQLSEKASETWKEEVSSTAIQSPSRAELNSPNKLAPRMGHSIQSASKTEHGGANQAESEEYSIHKLSSLPLDKDAFIVLPHFPELPEAEFLPLPEWLKPASSAPDKPQAGLWLGLSTTGGRTAPALSGNGAGAINDRQQLQPGEQAMIGLNLSYRLPAMEWQTGIGYAQNTVRNTSIRLQLFDSVPVRNPQGDTIGFFRFNYRDSLLNEMYTNRYRYLCIPLHAGKTWNINAKNSIYTELGVNWLTLIGNDSRILSTDLNTLMAEDALLKKNLMSWQLEIAYRRKFGLHWEAEAGFLYQQAAGGIYQSGQDLRHQLSASSLHLGIHYRIYSPKNNGL